MNAVLFTSILGRCDTLKRAPQGIKSVCFTDDVSLFIANPPGWEIRMWRYGGDSRRASRRLRLSSHTLFPDDLSIWLDAGCELTDASALIADIGEAEMAVMSHPNRKTCWEEAQEVIRINQANPEVIKRQVEEYSLYPDFVSHLAWGGLLARRVTERTIAFNELWLEHIERYGDNDQVSMDFCAWKVGLQFTYVRGHIYNNPYLKYYMGDHHARRRAYVL